MTSPVVQQALDFFQQKGYAPHQAVGIVANLMQESGLDPNGTGDYSGKTPTAFGVAQWRGERFQRLQEYADQQGTSWKDLNTQLGFVDHELKTSETGAYDKLMAAKDVGQATAAFIYYERPAAFNPDDPYNSPEYKWRMAHADAITGGTAVANSSTATAIGDNSQAVADASAPKPPARAAIQNVAFQPIQDKRLVDVLQLPASPPIGMPGQPKGGMTMADIFRPMPLPDLDLPKIPDPPPADVAIAPTFTLPPIRTGAIQRALAIGKKPPGTA